MDEYFVSHKAYKIDAKGRISIPANMRTALGNEFIASRGVGKCLALYPMEKWNAFMASIQEKVTQSDRKKLQFYFSANAEKLSLDGQGRVLLNEALRKQVNLFGETQAEIFGNNDHIEIWNCDLFNEQLNSINEQDVEGILDSYGI